MEKQNITLSIRKDILQKIKVSAAMRDTSVSAMITQALEEIIAREEGYKRAQKNHTRVLKEEISMGTHGSSDWSRDDLHDR